MDRLRNLGFLIKHVTRLYTQNFERNATELNLTLSQCKVLGHLSRNEGVTQIGLADASETDPMTLVRTLDRMERDGWVERRSDPEDRRSKRLYLRPAAQPIVEQMWRISDRGRAQALAGLSAAEREQLMTLLEKVRDNLMAQLAAPAEPAAPLTATRKGR